MIDRYIYAKDDSFKCLAKSKGLWATVWVMCCWSCLFSSSSTNESICGKVSWKWQSMSCITKQGHVFQAYLSLAVLFLSCGSPHLDQACSGLQEISLGYKQAPYQAALHGFGEAFLVCGKLGFKRLPTAHSHGFQLWGFTQCLLFYTPYKYKSGTVWWQHRFINQAPLTKRPAKATVLTAQVVSQKGILWAFCLQPHLELCIFLVLKLKVMIMYII